MDDWLSRAADAFSETSGVPREDFELDRPTEMTLLDLARVAAHDSDARTNAPLLCFLAGIARGRGASLTELADAVTKGVR